MQLTLTMLDTTFHIDTDNAADLHYTLEFMRAYEQPAKPRAKQASQEIQVRRATQVGFSPETTIPVHRSKHPHWHFDGARLPDGAIAWPSRGISVAHDGDDGWRVGVSEGTRQALVGEGLFHLLRSVALYRRASAPGPLLHASGVVRNGAATLFTGAVSAGKTTLLTESVIKHGATPLTNDRARVVLTEQRAVAESWPSYASFCEGTLLDHDVLRSAAENFERDSNPVRTIAFDGPLKPAYDKFSKRIYPMAWFTDAVGTQFAATAPLRTVAISRLDVTCDRTDVRVLSYDDESDRREISQVVNAERFDNDEPSFRPWHGLHLPESEWPVDRVLNELQRLDVRALSVRANPHDLSFLTDVL